MRGRVRLGMYVVIGCLWALPVRAQDYPYQPAYPAHQPHYSGYHGGYAQLEAELIPDSRAAFADVFYRDVTLHNLIHDSLHGAWMRLEYLNYRVSDPERVLLGAPLAGVANPNLPFTIDDNDNTNPLPLTARVPALEGIDFTNLNGIRGSFGLPVFEHGWLEGTAWGLSRATSESFSDLLPFTNPLGIGIGGTPGVQMLATSLLGNGTAGNRLLLYDQDFRAIYQTDIWSGEFNYVFDYITPQEGVTFQPIVGYRHIQYSENMHFGGTFSNVSLFNPLDPVLANPTRSSILSEARNTMHGGQLGFRSELIMPYLTLGVEPKLVLMSNQVRARVTTNNLRVAAADGLEDDLLVPNRFVSLTDPTRQTRASDSQVSPGFDLGLYAKVNLTSWFNIRVGYNLLWLSNLSTAENNVFYNDDGDTVNDATNNPGVVVRQYKFSDRFIDGLSIGGEILLP